VPVSVRQEINVFLVLSGRLSKERTPIRIFSNIFISPSKQVHYFNTNTIIPLITLMFALFVISLSQTEKKTN
jgi:hypothetical protein